MLARGLGRAAVSGKVNNDLAERCPVAAVIDLVQRGAYYQASFNSKSELGSAACREIMRLRAERGSSMMGEAAWGILDPRSTGVLLLGKEGLGTPFHVDRTQAENIAFPVSLLDEAQAGVPSHASRPHLICQLSICMCLRSQQSEHCQQLALGMCRRLHQAVMQCSVCNAKLGIA